MVHPDFSDVQSSKNANAKIRYTTGGKIVYFRGHRLSDPPGYPQYQGLARQVIGASFFRGSSYSFGDDFTARCAAFGLRNPGNLGQWLEADMNHHMQYTIQQLERLIVEIKSAPVEDVVSDKLFEALPA